MHRALDDAGVTFNMLFDQLIAHFGEKTTHLAARHEFSRVVQKESQSVDEFAAILRRSSLYCQFGADLDDCLRDQLLVGLRSESIRMRIMKRDNITFDDALKLAAHLKRITCEAKLGASKEASVLRVKAFLQLSGESSGPSNNQQLSKEATSGSSIGTSIGG